jgi:hypothetical protein
MAGTLSKAFPCLAAIGEAVPTATADFALRCGGARKLLLVFHRSVLHQDKMRLLERFRPLNLSYSAEISDIGVWRGCSGWGFLRTCGWL